MTVPVAGRRAVASLLSGPAAAPVAASQAVAPYGIKDYLVTDMGGTSYDVALVQGGEPLVTQENWLGGRHIALPSLDIHTLGAGGGSIAWTDQGASSTSALRAQEPVPAPPAMGREAVSPRLPTPAWRWAFWTRTIF